MFKESKIRSIIKTVSWRFWATLTTVALVLFFTGQTELALSIGGLEVILKMIVYFVHERTWDKIKFGRHEVQPAVLWFTGLSGSGKRRISSAVYQYLLDNGYKVEYLNGESVRKLFPEVGFTREERNGHIQRVGHLASTLEKHGIFVVASFESPFRESRHFVRDLCNNFVEIYVATPLEYCAKEDKRGLYSSARSGKVKNLTGVDAPYEEPQNPDLTVDISLPGGVDEAIKKVIEYLDTFI